MTITRRTGVAVELIRAVDHDATAAPAAVWSPVTDGVKHCAMNILYSLRHLGYTIPPQADAGRVGEAGPGPSYLDEGSGGPTNDFTNRNTTFMTWNLLHMARMLKDAHVRSRAVAEEVVREAWMGVIRGDGGFEGYSAEGVCAALDLSQGNQRVLLHRARSRVRSALEQHLP